MGTVLRVTVERSSYRLKLQAQLKNTVEEPLIFSISAARYEGHHVLGEGQ